MNSEQRNESGHAHTSGTGAKAEAPPLAPTATDPLVRLAHCRALGFFALLFLLLTSDAIETSVNSALRTEARVAMLAVLDDVQASPPYWPGQLTTHVVDTYRDPDVVVEVLDAKGQVRYLSTNGARIPISNETNVPCSLAHRGTRATPPFSTGGNGPIHRCLHGTRDTPWQLEPARAPITRARRAGAGRGDVQ